MGNNEFAVRLVAGLLEARTGQKLHKDRHWRIETALSGLLRERGILSVTQLVDQLLQPNQTDLAQAVVEALLNNETYFYRDRTLFDMLATRILPDLARRRATSRRLAIWSAGCSTGQEAYSLAMMLADQPSRWAGWTIDIVGTDVSHSVVKTARKGCFTSFQIQRGLGVQQMLSHFDETPEGWMASRALQRMVRFEVGSVLDTPPLPGVFDLILCRNVLLYFDGATRARALERMAQAMSSDAVLMLGGGETAVGHCDQLRPCKEFGGFFRLGSARKDRPSVPARLAG
jgi:chemotaxis protein methyltransferase CheR